MSHSHQGLGGLGGWDCGVSGIAGAPVGAPVGGYGPASGTGSGEELVADLEFWEIRWRADLLVDADRFRHQLPHDGQGIGFGGEGEVEPSVIADGEGRQGAGLWATPGVRFPSQPNDAVGIAPDPGQTLDLARGVGRGVIGSLRNEHRSGEENVSHGLVLDGDENTFYVRGGDSTVFVKSVLDRNFYAIGVTFPSSGSAVDLELTGIPLICNEPDVRIAPAMCE